jgi:glutathione S-transferase
MIKIHNFPRGARGLRVMWQCEEMGLPYQVERVSFPTSAAYRALHPLGTVPFLEDEGGVALGESVAMMLYVAEKYGPTYLLPGRDEPAAFARVLHLVVLGEATLGAGLNPLMSARFVAPEADKRNWSVRSGESRSEQLLRYLAGMLGDQPFLLGDRFTLADICVSTSLVMWTGALGHPLPDTLAAYQQRLATRPAYERARAANG